MANNIGVKSPYFVTIGASAGESFFLNVNINGTLRYELFKVISDSATFEISELIRDYINISYDGTMPTATEYTTNSNGYIADVALGWGGYDNPEGTGTPLSPGGISLVAYDGYKFFEESGYNYSLPNTEVLLTSKTIWLPENTAGTFYYTDATVLNKYDVGTTTEGDISVAGETITIKRFDCSKYDPVKLVFVNRFGMLQELWFFGKTIESSSFASDRYKSGNIAANGSYDRYEHQYKKFDVKGQVDYTINTGFVSEDYNSSIEELLLSDQVWMHVDSTVKPVNTTSSSVTYRTSLNDKMVQYTIQVEQANDLISTMR